MKAKRMIRSHDLGICVTMFFDYKIYKKSSKSATSINQQDQPEKSQRSARHCQISGCR